ncbi:MAG: hypothetical protein JWO77_3734 [Ilumatobacteraceae bacterium]|nr:hypothetical protein [Ilumatobacteraceae bacterium]
MLVAALAIGLAACQPANPPNGSTSTSTPTATTTTTTRTTTTTPSGSGSWTLIGGDEFNGPGVDAANWRALHSTYGDANLELACLMPGNVAVAAGQATITPRHQPVTCPGGQARSYTSGFLSARDAGRYFPLEIRVEVRAKVPHAQGLWPAAWLRHVNGASSAEVDIMEYFHSAVPGRTTQTLHLDGRTNVAKATTAIEAPGAPSAWHVWAVEISRTDADGDGIRDDVSFRFLTDGAETLRYTDTRHGWAGSGDPRRTWDVALNLAVGGRWVGRPDGALGVLEDLGRCAQTGTPPACRTTGINRVDWAAPSANAYAVDYVRVYEHSS